MDDLPKRAEDTRLETSSYVNRELELIVDEMSGQARSIDNHQHRSGLSNDPISLGSNGTEAIRVEIHRRQSEILQERKSLGLKTGEQSNLPNDKKTRKLTRSLLKLRSRSRLQRVTVVTLLQWISGLFAVYLLLALPLSQVSTPTETDDSANIQAGADEPEESNTTNQPGKESLAFNSLVLAAVDMRGYLARMTGALPLACYGRGDTLKAAKEENPQQNAVAGDADIGEVTQEPDPVPQGKDDDWTMNGTPLLVQLRPDYINADSPCGWYDMSRQDTDSLYSPNRLATHALAAVSLDVGTIQKATLLIFILGWNLIGLAKRDIDLTKRVMEADNLSEGLPAAMGLETTMFPGRPMVITSGGDRSVEPLNGKEPAANNVPDWQRDDPVDAGAGNLIDPYDAYAKDVSFIHDYWFGFKQMRDSFLVLAISYISEIVDQGLSYRTRAPIAGFTNEQAGRLRDDVFRRFWLSDYVVWMLPTIGFLGTIYGISLSLVKARLIFDQGGDNAANDFGAVVNALGTAFDTTAFALLLLSFLMVRKMWTEKTLSAETDYFIGRVRRQLVLKLRDLDRICDVELLREAHQVINAQKAYIDETIQYAPDPDPDTPPGAEE